MKPISLTIEAFGPYRDSVTLDFNELQDHSMFLIAGPTGAGKTSILVPQTCSPQETYTDIPLRSSLVFCPIRCYSTSRLWGYNSSLRFPHRYIVMQNSYNPLPYFQNPDILDFWIMPIALHKAMHPSCDNLFPSAYSAACHLPICYL